MSDRRSSAFGRLMKWLLYGCAALVLTYVVLFTVVLSAMLSGPERFGQFMKRMPGALVWGALPAPRMWLWARSGVLSPGDPAPDFSLLRQGRSDRVTLSSYRGQRPVVLVFGSYT